MNRFKSMLVFLMEDIVINLKNRLDNIGIRPNNDTYSLKRSLKKLVREDRGEVRGNHYALYLEKKYNYVENGYQMAVDKNSEEILEASWEEIVKSIKI